MKIQRKKFEVRAKETKGRIENVIFINDEPLDWSVDMDSYAKAVKMGPDYVKVVQESIANHFVDAVSEVLGRKVTMADINKAKITGWI